ncbi:winged helix-turn-helix transcriptional regulator [Candidatus Saccharibacteria bacterium]|nr:winged helix-turn-helix transcriptional regulator [Candidatus Saccharibacteria bacterium]
MDGKLATYYKVLSNPVRLRIFMYIAENSESFSKPKQESCVSEISKAIGIPQPTASNHLRALKRVGLVKSTSVGTRCYQYVTKDAAEYLLRHTQHIFEQASKSPY